MSRLSPHQTENLVLDHVRWMREHGFTERAIRQWLEGQRKSLEELLQRVEMRGM